MDTLTRLTCRIPTPLVLRIEEVRNVHLQATGRRLPLRRVIQTALEHWLRDTKAVTP